MYVAVGEAQADVIKLRTNSDMARYSEIHAAAGAPAESVRAAETADREAIRAHKSLYERRDTLAAIGGQARAAEEGKGVGRGTRLGKVINTEIPDNTEPIVQV